MNVKRNSKEHYYTSFVHCQKSKTISISKFSYVTQ